MFKVCISFADYKGRLETATITKIDTRTIFKIEFVINKFKVLTLIYKDEILIFLGNYLENNKQ